MRFVDSINKINTYMIGNISIPANTSLADGTTSFAGFTLAKVNSNESMATFQGIDASGKPVVLTVSQGALKPTASSYGRHRVRIKCVSQVPEESRTSDGVTTEGVPIYGTSYVDSIVDVSISVPTHLSVPAMLTLTFQYLNNFVTQAPEVITTSAL